MIFHQTPFVVAALVLSAGITLLISIQIALVIRASSGFVCYRYFPSLSLVISCYLMATAFLYVENDFEHAVLALKVQAMMLCVFPFLMFRFVSVYTISQQTNKTWTYGLAIFFAICFIVNLLSPYSIRFTSIEPMTYLILPWGEVLHIYTGEMSILFRLFPVVVVGIVCWSIYRGVLIARRDKRPEGYWLAASLGLLMATAVWGRLIDLGLIHSFYTLGVGFLALVLFVSFDLTHQMKAQHRKLSIASVSFKSSKPTVITDAEINILQVNHAFETVTGYSAEEALGQKISFIGDGALSAPERQAIDEMIKHSIASTGNWFGELTFRRKNGELYPVEIMVNPVSNEKNVTTHYVTSFKDISQQKNAESYTRQLELTDPLTGLDNRRSLKEKIAAAQMQSAQNYLFGALLIIDIDSFSKLNHLFGNSFGDILLNQIAHQLQQFSGEKDTLARIDGDEFVVFFEAVAENEDTALQQFLKTAETIRQVLNAPYTLLDKPYQGTVSIGFSVYCGAEKSPDELIKSAEMALSQAKLDGGNRVRFCDEILQKLVADRSAMEVDLKTAIGKNQLRLYYQVQVNGDRCPIGVEALIRWIHPRLGMISPMIFIPIAEQSSLILELGDWVLDTACRQLAVWAKHEQTRHLVMAINVSAAQFREQSFMEKLKLVIEKYALDSSRIKLEITESVALGDIEHVAAKMRALREELGIKISLDDFGTGFSSLSYLKNLPLDQLKIDQSFVRQALENPVDIMMIKTIIQLARNLGLEVIAEGVETERHFEILHAMGCQAYQGYLFGKPVPIEQF